MTAKKVIIIGAGIGGIATANLLAKAGYRVDVYEKNSMAGGRAGLIEADGFKFDSGPSWYLMPEVFEQYYRLLGSSTAKELDLIKLSPAYKVFFENQASITVTGDENIDRQTFEKIEPGAGKKLHDYVNDGNRVYDLSMKHFLYTNFSRLSDLLKLDIMRSGPALLSRATTSLHSHVAKRFSDQRLQQILEYPMVFLGSSPYQAPAIYSLMSALDFKEGVFYPKGGMYEIIRSLLRHSDDLGVSYHFDQSVEKITTRDGRATGVIVNGESIPADIVISNADLHFTETKLLETADQSFPNSYWTKKQAGPSALLMYLGVKSKLPELEHHNLLFVDDWKQNFEDIYKHQKLPESASIYICKPSATDDSVAPVGQENIFVLVPLPAKVRLDTSQLEAAADRYLAQISKMTGLEALSDNIVYKQLFGPNQFQKVFNAWQNTALGPSHILRQSAIFRTPNASKRLDNLFYVGGFSIPGVGLPMCLIGAELTYKRVVGDKTSGPLKSVNRTDS